MTDQCGGGGRTGKQKDEGPWGLTILQRAASSCKQDKTYMNMIYTMKSLHLRNEEIDCMAPDLHIVSNNPRVLL